jgi:hypothetical protein
VVSCSRVFTELVVVSLLVAIVAACGSAKSEPPNSPEAITPTAQPLVATSGPRLRIPKILVDAPVVVKAISPEGKLPNPETREEVVVYDLAQYGNKADPKAGNVVVTGFLDSGSVPCFGGYVPSPCFAVFGSLSLLEAGDEISLTLNESTVTYHVVGQCWIENAHFDDAFLKDTSYQAITLTTSAGTFSEATRTYSHTLAVRAVSQTQAPGLDCGRASASPPPSPTPNPRTAPAVQSGPHEIRSIQGSGAASRSDEASVAVTTDPNSRCVLSMKRSSGVRVLGFNVTADGSGTANFRWRIPDYFPSESYVVAVACGGAPKTVDLAVR